MNRLDSGEKLIDQDSPYRWWSVYFCIFMLMIATVSPPEEFKISNAGTQSILPPAILKLLKLAARGCAAMILVYSLLAASGSIRFRKTFPRMLPILAFGAFGVVSVAWSPEKSTSIVQVASFVTLLLLAWLVAIYWSSEMDISRILRFASFVLMFISLGLIVLHFADPRVAALTRDSSGLFHSTMSGSAASLAVVTLFSCHFIWGWGWTKQLLLPATVIHVGTMMIGGNRLSLALALLVCGVAFLLTSKIISIAWAMLAAAVVGIGYLCLDPGLLMSDSLVEKLNQFTVQGQSQHELGSFSGRTEMWEKMWDSYLKSPLIGHGYFVTSPTARIFVWGEWGNWTAHNFFLQVLVTLGAVGLLMLVAGIGVVAWPVLKKLGGHDRAQYRSALLLALMGMWFLGWGTLNESFIGPLSPESVMFALLLGFGVALANQASAAKVEDESTCDRVGQGS